MSDSVPTFHQTVADVQELYLSKFPKANANNHWKYLVAEFQELMQEINKHDDVRAFEELCDCFLSMCAWMATKGKDGNDLLEAIYKKLEIMSGRKYVWHEDAYIREDKLPAGHPDRITQKIDKTDLKEVPEVVGEERDYGDFPLDEEY